MSWHVTPVDLSRWVLCRGKGKAGKRGSRGLNTWDPDWLGGPKSW